MENNALQIFTYGKNTVRTIIKDGEPWFVAKDVCDVLGLTNSRKAISSLQEEGNFGFGGIEKTTLEW